jgi:hypothetical protein
VAIFVRRCVLRRLSGVQLSVSTLSGITLQTRNQSTSKTVDLREPVNELGADEEWLDS